MHGLHTHKLFVPLHHLNINLLKSCVQVGTGVKSHSGPYMLIFPQCSPVKAGESFCTHIAVFGWCFLKFCSILVSCPSRCSSCNQPEEASFTSEDDSQQSRLFRQTSCLLLMNSPLWERTAQKKTSWIRSQWLGRLWPLHRGCCASLIKSKP